MQPRWPVTPEVTWRAAPDDGYVIAMQYEIRPTSLYTLDFTDTRNRGRLAYCDSASTPAASQRTASRIRAPGPHHIRPGIEPDSGCATDSVLIPGAVSAAVFVQNARLLVAVCRRHSATFSARALPTGVPVSDRWRYPRRMRSSISATRSLRSRTWSSRPDPTPDGRFWGSPAATRTSSRAGRWSSLHRNSGSQHSTAALGWIDDGLSPPCRARVTSHSTACRISGVEIANTFSEACSGSSGTPTTLQPEERHLAELPRTAPRFLVPGSRRPGPS